MAPDTVKYRHWRPDEIATLRRLARPQQLFMKEIAELMGLPVVRVRHQARRLGIVSRPKGRMGKWNSKHAHLAEASMRYFLTHSYEETRIHFGLSPSEVKSLFTRGYLRPEYKHLRKDRRRHDAWTVEEKLFFLRHAGLRERRWIAKRLRRGTMHAIKDLAADQMGGIWTKQLHGLPHKTVREVLELELASIETKAGPVSEHHSFRYKIVPWVVLADAIRWNRRVPPEIKSAIRALAQFQRWIYGTRTTEETLSKLKQAIGGKLGKRRSESARDDTGSGSGRPVRTVQHEGRRPHPRRAHGQGHVRRRDG